MRAHLAKVIEAMTVMQPADPLEAFEDISRAVRKGGCLPSQVRRAAATYAV